MKKISLLLAIISTCIATSPGCLAQTVASGGVRPDAVLKIYNAGMDPSATRAVGDLWKTYGDKKNESWDRLSDGFRAKFSENNIQYSIYYDKKGNWSRTLRQYSEKELPKEIGEEVRRCHHGYSILWIKEISGPEGIAYQVHIESPTRWKNLWVSDGDMLVTGNFAKE
jgi:hypothetical protein